MKMPRHPSWKLLALALVIKAGPFSAGAAHAQTGEKPFFRYGVSQALLWNSNPLMLRNNVEDIYGSETRGFFGFQREMATSKVELDLTALRNQYVQSEYNSTDLYAKTMLEKTLQSWKLGLTGTYDYDTTRSSEITTFGRDVGLGRRNAFNLQPSVSYMLSERSTLGLTARWNEVRYDTNRLTDYRIASLTSAYTYNLTPLQTASLSLQAQRYALLDDEDLHIDSVGPYLGWKYNFHPNWTLSLSGGSIASKINGYPGVKEEWDYNVVYGTSLNYKDETNDSALSATRSRQPYANGTEALLTTIEARHKHNVNEKLDFELKGSYQFAKQPETANESLDTAWSGSASLGYKIGYNWTADLSYRYRNEELTNVDDDAEQQVVRLGLTYRFGYDR